MSVGSMIRTLEDSANKGNFHARVRVFSDELTKREQFLKKEGFTISKKSRAFNCDAYILLVNWSSPTSDGKAMDLKRISKEVSKINLL